MKSSKHSSKETLLEQYALSRRMFLQIAGVGLASAALRMTGIANSANAHPFDPLAPTLPQQDGPFLRRQRLDQLKQARIVYATDLRLPDARQVAVLPVQESFSPGYLGNRQALEDQINANLATFFANAGPEPFQTRDDYTTAFPVLPVPPIADNYQLDTVFARQRIAGINPMEIINVRNLDYRLSEKLPITDELFQASVCTMRALNNGRQQCRYHRHTLAPGRRRQLSLARAAAEGRLFVTDYAVLDSVAPKPFQFFAAPVALYYVDPHLDNQLIPIAIQVGQIPGESLLCTPMDGLDWDVAKTVLQTADVYVHEMWRHLGQTHLALESFALAMRRELAERHPLHVFLKPHFEFTMAINALGDAVLIAPGGFIDAALPGTRESSLDLINGAIKTQFDDFAGSAFPKDIRRRGLDDHSALPDFPYRDDGQLVWNALRDYVIRYVFVYYRNNRDVREDYELQNWLRTLRTPIDQGGFGVRSLPEKLSDRHDLIRLLTQIIFNAGPQHSAIAWTQYEHVAFIPNMPAALYQPIPETKGTVLDETDLVAFLPDTQLTFAQINLITAIRNKHDPKEFGDYGANSFHDPRAIAVLDRLHNRLSRIEKRIERRNRRRPESYPGFLPSRMANSASS